MLKFQAQVPVQQTEVPQSALLIAPFAGQFLDAQLLFSSGLLQTCNAVSLPPCAGATVWP
jgi:hypothetical protein